MSTTLDIKNDVSIQLGKDNGSITDAKRDNAIIRARRKFYKEYPWSFLLKNATITFSDGEAEFPEDYNDTFEPKIYSYSGTLKTEYKLRPLDDVSGHTSDFPVFGIDYSNKKFSTNLDGTVNISYRIRVSDTLDNSYVEPCDDISAIDALSIAYFWLGKERNDDMFKMWMGVYDTELSRLVREDRLRQPVRKFREDTTDYGYNDGSADA